MNTSLASLNFQVHCDLVRDLEESMSSSYELAFHFANQCLAERCEILIK